MERKLSQTIGGGLYNAVNEIKEFVDDSWQLLRRENNQRKLQEHLEFMRYFFLREESYNDYVRQFVHEGYERKRKADVQKVREDIAMILQARQQAVSSKDTIKATALLLGDHTIYHNPDMLE